MTYFHIRFHTTRVDIQSGDSLMKCFFILGTALKQLIKSLRIQKLVLTKMCEQCRDSIGEVGVNPKDTISAHIRKLAAILCFLQWFSSSSFFLFFRFFKGVQCPILAFKKSYGIHACFLRWVLCADAVRIPCSF